MQWLHALVLNSGDSRRLEQYRAQLDNVCMNKSNTAIKHVKLSILLAFDAKVVHYSLLFHSIGFISIGRERFGRENVTPHCVAYMPKFALSRSKAWKNEENPNALTDRRG